MCSNEPILMWDCSFLVQFITKINKHITILWQEETSKPTQWSKHCTWNIFVFSPAHHCWLRSHTHEEWHNNTGPHQINPVCDWVNRLHFSLHSGLSVFPSQWTMFEIRSEWMGPRAVMQVGDKAHLLFCWTYQRQLRTHTHTNTNCLPHGLTCVSIIFTETYLRTQVSIKLQHFTFFAIVFIMTEYANKKKCSFPTHTSPSICFLTHDCLILTISGNELHHFPQLCSFINRFK